MDAWWDTTCASRKARTLSRRTYWRFKRNLESRSSSCGMTGFENLRLLYSSSSTRTRVSRSQFRTLINQQDSWAGHTNDCYHWTQHVAQRKIGQVFLVRDCYDCFMRQESASVTRKTNNTSFKIVDKYKPSIKHMRVFGVELTLWLRRKSGSSGTPSLELTCVRWLWKRLQDISDLRHWSSESGDQSRCRQVLAI